MPEVKAPTPGTLCWLELATTDPRTAQPFYAGILGMSYTENPMDNGQPYVMMHASGGEVGGLYQLMPEQVAQGVPPHWMPYVAVENADASVEKAKELGGTLVAGPFDVMQHGRMAVVRDPGGATFSLWQTRQHPGFGVKEGTGTLCWAEVNTRHFAECKAFYTGLFGWETQSLPGMEFQYDMFQLGGQPVVGLLEMDARWEGIPSHWMVYFAVPDADKAATQATELGGRVSVPPFDTPYGRISVLADPQGAVFSICRLAATAAA